MATQFEHPAPTPTARPQTRRRALGRYGEDLACRHLVDLGMVVLDRNWRCDRGELDIVAAAGRTLVICEVKTRTSARFGRPEEAVTGVKLARLRMLAGIWLEQHSHGRPEAGNPCESATRTIRVDVVAVLRPPRGPALLTHFPGVG